MVGYAAILGAVLIWALSYIVMKTATTDYPQLLFQFWRYAAVAAIYTLFFYRSVRTIPAALWRKGFGWLGLSIFALSIFSIYAVQYTTPTRVVVINSLVIAVVPLLRWVHGRSKPTRPELAAIGIAMLAILLLLGPQESDVQLGDGLAFLGMIGYAYMIVLIDRMLAKDNATVVQVSYLGIVGCACYFIAAAAVYAAVRPEGLAVQALLKQPSTIGGIVFMVLFVSLAANLLQVIGQRRLSPVTVSILFCLEPAATAVLDYFLLGNVPSFRLILSGLLLIAATVVASVRFRRKTNAAGLPAEAGRSDATLGQ